MSKKEMLECFQYAKEVNAKFIAVSVKAKGSNGTEIIINPNCNIDQKMSYYESAYDDNLLLNANNDIRIVGFCYADSYEDICNNLWLHYFEKGEC